MNQRTSIRAIAKDRLAAMEVPHIGKIMGLGMSHTRNQNLQRTRRGRTWLAKMRVQKAPVWRRVTSGSLTKDGIAAQMGIGKKRRFRG